MNNEMTKLSNDVNKNFNKEDGYWQTILDLGYAEWQNEKNEDVNSYTEMIEWMRNKYGNFAVLAILLGKFNQQVCNGGHMQYYDNGYASRDDIGARHSGFGHSHGEQIDLHLEIVELMKEFGLDTKSKLSKSVFDIINRFEVHLDEDVYIDEDCYKCGGMSYVDNPDFDYDDEDSDEDETIECELCDGSGIDEVENPEYGHPYNTSDWNSLDTEYYNICDKWETYFENFVKEMVA